MSKTEKILTLTVVALAIVVFLFAVGTKNENQSTPPLGGLVPMGVPFQGVATSGRATILGTTGDTLPKSLLATTSNRVYAAIVNDCASAVYLTFKDLRGAATTSFTDYAIRLNANGGSYEITQENLYTGPVFASSTAVCNVYVTQSVNVSN